MKISNLARIFSLLIAYSICAPAHSQPWQDESVTLASHYSPAENLERLDVDALRRAHGSIDIAIYAFTDRLIAEELIELAHRGVHIRIYRDREQWEQEQSRRNSTTEMMADTPNVEIRVKRSKTLMHEKCFVLDGALLRCGSANWSPTGLKRQDNNARYTSDRAEIRAFERTFEDMWDREGNQIVR